MFGKDDADRTERGPRLSFSLGLLLVDLIAVILLSMFNYNVFYVESRDSYKENFVEYERNISRIAFDNIENQFVSYMKIPDFYFASIPQNDSLLLPQREDIMGNAECVRALSDALYVIRSTYPYLYSMDIYYERTGTIVTGFGNIHQTVEKEKVAELCPWLEMMPEDSESCILPLSDNSYPTKEPVITYVRKITSAMWEGWQYQIMPALALSGMPTSFIARLTRSSMLDVLGQDYIKTARAKGLSRFTVLFKHALPNSLIPVVTYAGPMTAGILTGSFVIENIFAIPGLGQYFVTSIYNRDYTVILGVTIFYSIIIIVLNMIVDLIYPFLDPRIKLGGGKGE